MSQYSSNGFYAEHCGCRVKYFIKDNDYQVDKLIDLKKELIYCKNTNDYIAKFIEYIKDNVIKRCKNLEAVKIKLAIFDKNNILHKFIVTVSSMLINLLKSKQKIDFYKSIFVIVKYEKEIVFMGDINFKGLD